LRAQLAERHHSILVAEAETVVGLVSLRLYDTPPDPSLVLI